jgi:precorrin-4/cobalt-precorrin-4 C11-methyltransferase
MKKKSMVYFVGAGPGDPDLITVKGRKCIQDADLVLYAGSLVPKEVLACARKDARVADSSSMTLQETHAMILETARAGGIAARVHTGDPSLYGAVKEQMILLDRDGVSYEVIPGVTAAFAAAAAARVSFTVPEITQTLIFTRIGGRTAVPEQERLQLLAAHGCSLAIYLSADNPSKIVEELLAGGYADHTPVVVAYRVGWPEEMILRCKISDLSRTVKGAGIKRQALFLILPGTEKTGHSSKLYDRDFSHGFRSKKG